MILVVRHLKKMWFCVPMTFETTETLMRRAASFDMSGKIDEISWNLLPCLKALVKPSFSLRDSLVHTGLEDARRGAD
jgi:hypothetical protein